MALLPSPSGCHGRQMGHGGLPCLRGTLNSDSLKSLSVNRYPSPRAAAWPQGAVHGRCGDLPSCPWRGP